ncbi:hypothetical protein EDB80DRAFT_738311 [Ilyonectria destructans]|nr:hypothetical protein EDB80DRAFT_738311 [Ilyonectria destructans]
MRQATSPYHSSTSGHESSLIQAWVDELETSPVTTHPVDTTLTVDPLLNNAHQRRLSDEMSSPSKRPRTSEYSDSYPDPTRLQQAPDLS